METKSYYDILGVSVKASTEEITAAKNNLAKKYHPDVNIKHGIDTTSQMQEILEAYKVLSNPAIRAEYDRKLRRTRPQMQTFTLSEEDDMEDPDNPTFVTYWKSAGTLFEIIEEYNALSRRERTSGQLTALSIRALAQVLKLRNAAIPERYWYPDIMNWLFFRWLQNRNYCISYLLTLYDEYEKKEMSTLDRIKLQNHSSKYRHTIKKLMKY